MPNARKQGVPSLAGALWVLLILLWFCTPVGAHHVEGPERVELALPNGLVATARYHGGHAGPAVLLLHGFLQTSEYLTVSSLISGLMDQGYTVLAPTLSLGVDRRRGSMDCKAIHTHTLQEDLAEIQAWIDWMEDRGHGRIALVGHSFGSLKLLAYLAGHPSPSASQLVATSLVGIDNELSGEAFSAMVDRARTSVSAGYTSLDTYQVSYCDNYPTTSAAFLSYAVWTREQVLRSLADIKVPVRIILGEEDRRFHPEWIAQLKATEFDVLLIPGAGHFFDGLHEFELLDRVSEALQASPAEMR